jgi:hypothetical protein
MLWENFQLFNPCLTVDAGPRRWRIAFPRTRFFERSGIVKWSTRFGHVPPQWNDVQMSETNGFYKHRKSFRFHRGLRGFDRAHLVLL